MSSKGTSHFDWFARRFRNGVDVHNVAFEKGWVRVVNKPQELQLNLNMKKFNIKQRKRTRNIFDENHKRTLYVDVWTREGGNPKHNKLFDDYGDIVDFLSKV